MGKLVVGKIKFIGTKKPLSRARINKKFCIRCGEPARHQWACCANGSKWFPVCNGCDIALNDLVINFMKFENGGALISAYRARVFREQKASGKVKALHP